jgi:toxin ParE1/3/4
LKRFRTTQQADEDLIVIYTQGLDSFGVRQADLYFEKLHQAFQHLADHPALARLRMEYDPPIRAFVSGSHVILYDEVPAGIVIVRIRHRLENWQDDPRGLDHDIGTP